MTFTEKDVDAIGGKYGKRSIDFQTWPENDENGIPYEIYKAKSNYSYKNSFCKFFIFIFFLQFKHLRFKLNYFSLYRCR
jgi:hypothetical protein